MRILARRNLNFRQTLSKNVIRIFDNLFKEIHKNFRWHFQNQLLSRYIQPAKFLLLFIVTYLNFRHRFLQGSVRKFCSLPRYFAFSGFSVFFCVFRKLLLPRNYVWLLQDCVEMFPYYLYRGTWNDITCHKRLPFVCQKNSKKSTTPYTPPKTDCPSGYEKYAGNCYRYAPDLSLKDNFSLKLSQCPFSWSGKP